MTEMWPGQLLRLIENQVEAIGSVLDVIHKQREALKEGRLELLDDLMRDLDKAQRQASVCESLRGALVARIAAQEGCDPLLDSIMAIAPSDREELGSAGSMLRKAVSEAKVETAILSTLIEENRTLNEMMINEWRRLGGESASSGLDLKG